MGKNELPKVSPYTVLFHAMIYVYWFIFIYIFDCRKAACVFFFFFCRRAISLGMLHSMRLNFLSWHYLPRLHPLALVFLASGKADAEMVSRVQRDPEGMEGSQEGGRQRTQGRG